MNDKPTNQPTTAQIVTQAEELLRAGKALGSAIVPGKGLQPYAIVPAGYSFAPIPPQELLPLPDHIRQSVRLDDSSSFVAYVKAFRTHTTRVFAAAVKLDEVSANSAGGAEFLAFLDYHEGGKDPAPHRAAHTARFPVPLSLEFSTWLAKSTVPQTQMEFVSFIEANCADVVSPDSASLMEMALNFEAKTSAEFGSKVNRVTGGRSLTFQEKVDAGAPSVGQITVPEWLALRLPVFEGGKTYEFRARLEYRPSNGRLVITYHLHRAHDVFRRAHREMREEIAEALELEILTGHPGKPENDRPL